MRLILIFAALGVAFAGSASAGASLQPGAKALDDVRILSADDMEGRRIGAPGGAKARAYILGRFTEIDLKPQGAGFEHPFSFTRKNGSKVRGVNLLARIEGTRTPEKIMLVSAHYDHKGIKGGKIYNGADDNASGVAGLLAVAEAFRATPPEHTVIIAAWDGEESDLQGARAFVAQPSAALASITLNVNFDMLSKNAKSELYVSGAGPQPYLRSVLERVAVSAPVTLKLGHDTDAHGKHDNWTMQSDHGVFAAKAVPWLYFGVEDHAEYHKPTDDFETVPQAFFQNVVTTVVQATRALDGELTAIAKAAGR